MLTNSQKIAEEKKRYLLKKKRNNKVVNLVGFSSGHEVDTRWCEVFVY